MADDSMVMSEDDILALKETLFLQQEVLQSLHNDLDAEREAAATAASEALSMILRLQGEKASVKMEAEQYKRLAEERMCHAEESFAVIEDIIQEREMEVAALDHKVQTYRCKLLSMGCDYACDPCDNDLEFPETRLVHDPGSLSLRRRNSEPVLVNYKEVLIDSLSSSPGNETMLVLDSEKKADNSNHEGVALYSEKIRELSVLVTQIAGDNGSDNKNGTRSPPYFPSHDLNISNEVAVVADIKQRICPENLSNEGAPIDSHCTPSVLDVFEVPQADENCRCGQSLTDEKRKQASQNSEICDGKVLDHPEAVKLFTKDENDWLKKLLESTHDEKHLCKPSHIAAIERGVVVEPETSVTEPASSSSEPPAVKRTTSSTEPASSEPPAVKRTTTSTEPAAVKQNTASTVPAAVKRNTTSTEPGSIELAVVKPTTNITEPAAVIEQVEPATSVTGPAAIECAVVKPATSVCEPTASECAVIRPAKRTAASERAVAEPATNGPSIEHAVQPATSVTEPESSSNQNNRTLVTNEIDRLAQFANREAELKMLKEIKAKLNLLQAEIRRPGEEISSMRDQSYFPLPEAMLHFWL